MEYIEECISVRVRFSEVDAMGVVWHGNYLKYFEDGREKLGETFDMCYTKIANQGYFVPIVHVDMDYKYPIVFGQRIKITCRLIKKEAAKLIHEYEVWNLDDDRLSCIGKTEQVFLNKESRELVLTYPDFYEKWKKQVDWEKR